MAESPEPLPTDMAAAFAAVSSRLGRLGSRILFFPTIRSTNDVAMTFAASGSSEGAVVIAAAQTAGRGRRGRTWFSPPGAGLYASIVLDPSRTAGARDRALALLTLSAGVALAEAVERATGLSPAIKWPNDLIVGGRKLAGILAEGVVSRAGHEEEPRVSSVVLGYGINISRTAFPPDLTDRATSLEMELGRSVDSATLCAETVAGIAARYDDLLAGRFDAILDAWHSRAPASRGARVSWESPTGVRAGISAGVDEMGALLVQTGGVTERLIAGEVIWADRTS